MKFDPIPPEGLVANVLRLCGMVERKRLRKQEYIASGNRNHTGVKSRSMAQLLRRM